MAVSDAKPLLVQQATAPTVIWIIRLFKVHAREALRHITSTTPRDVPGSLEGACLAFSDRRDAWFFAGLTSSFPNVTESGADVLYEPRPCTNGGFVPGCKVFRAPSESSQAEQIEGDAMTSHSGAALQDQILVFQYRGKIHAVDNKCPHSAFPLAKGTPFDIEDFGVVLSSGITCPKHGWSFDLFTGRADHNNYMLRTWEVQLRPINNPGPGRDDRGGDEDAKEVWIRRKQRMG
ncbi:hypothetical protein F4861DRAFT_537069 [Xylaria intraflava]|nr:hypothetical protein F4861DRAFT_537069 [Xylaria intraflava]